MLFINNPQAAKAILEGRRHDEGQRAITSTTDTTRTSPSGQSSPGIRASRARVAPLLATN